MRLLLDIEFSFEGEEDITTKQMVDELAECLRDHNISTTVHKVKRVEE